MNDVSCLEAILLHPAGFFLYRKVLCSIQVQMPYH